MSLKPVNHAIKFIPNPHVSLNISIIHNPIHIMMAKSMRFHALPKWDSLRISIKAMAISTNSSDSSTKDTGNG